MTQIIPAKVSKQILALLREGDFAHPGEIEAIDLVMRPLPKNATQKILDVGCGLGGTANYLRQWGDVSAIDMNADMIAYVQKNHSLVRAIHSDVMQIQHHFPLKTFQLITIVSAFFCFPEQSSALQLLSDIADEKAELIIFDYSTVDFPSVKNPFTCSDSIHTFNPIFLPHIEKMLQKTNWQLKETKDITPQFIIWYEQLIEKFQAKRNFILKNFDEMIFDDLLKGYVQLVEHLIKKQLGGIIIYARKV